MMVRPIPDGQSWPRKRKSSETRENAQTGSCYTAPSTRENDRRNDRDVTQHATNIVGHSPGRCPGQRQPACAVRLLAAGNMVVPSAICVPHRYKKPLISPILWFAPNEDRTVAIRSNPNGESYQNQGSKATEFARQIPTGICPGGGVFGWRDQDKEEGAAQNSSGRAFNSI